jgi:hypothetical protein
LFFKGDFARVRREQDQQAVKLSKVYCPRDKLCVVLKNQ